MDITESMIRK